MKKFSRNQKIGNVEKIQKVKLRNNILERGGMLGMKEVVGEDMKKINAKGVTLISLVVTIVVLIILAGISIAIVSGDNGILKSAQRAQETSKLADIREEVDIKWIEVLKEAGPTNTTEELEQRLQDKLRQEDKDAVVKYNQINNTFEITYKDMMLEIQNNDTVTVKREEWKDNIEDIFNSLDPDLSLEDKADRIDEELKKDDPNSSAEYNPDTGEIDISHGDYTGSVDEDGNVEVKDPVVKEKPSIEITSEPSDVSIIDKGTATFSVSAITKGDVTYQWYRNTLDSDTTGTAIENANSSSYTTDVLNSESRNIYFYCEITARLNGETVTKKTRVAKANIFKKVEIAGDENTEKIVLEGEDASFEITATGEGELSYQWYKNSENSSSGGTPISGATNPTYTIEDTTIDDNNTYYYCVVTQKKDGATASVSSNPIKLIVLKSLKITKEPSNVETIEKSEVTFEVQAEGTGEIRYEWYRNTSNSTEGGTPIPGANSSTYTIPAEEVTTSLNGSYYYCKVTQLYNNEEIKTQNTKAVSLSVVGTIKIEKNIDSTSVYENVKDVIFDVKASGEGEITYQWYKNTKNNSNNGIKIEGETDNTYTIPAKDVTSELNGTYYYVVITQKYGSSTRTIVSNIALLEVKETSIEADITNVIAYVGGSDKSVTFNGTNMGEIVIESGSNNKYAIAQINPNNNKQLIIKPVSAGKTNVIIKETNGNKTVTINIEIKETSISADVTSVTMQYGGKSQKITLSGENTGEFEIVTLPDEKVATANKNGNEITIVPVKTGKTTIKIKENNGNKAIEIPITVEKATPQIVLNSKSGTVKYGETNSFIVTPNSQPAINGTWSVVSSNSNYIKITSGNNASATNGKETIISYKAENITAEEIVITVTFIPSDTINYNKQTAEYKVRIEKAIGTAQVKITGKNKIGETLTAGVITESDGVKSYQWWYSDKPTATSGTNIANATSETYVIQSAYVGKYIGCTVNIKEGTKYLAGTANDITDKTNNGADVVWQKPTIEIAPKTMETALGNSIKYTATTNGDYDEVSYQWYYNETNTSGKGQLGSTSNPYVFIPNSIGTYYISVVASYTYGTLKENVTSTTAKIVVNEANYSIDTGTVVTYYNTLAQANAAAKDEQTIKVIKNVTDPSIVSIEKSVILDTQNYVLTNKNTIYINETGRLTVSGTGSVIGSVEEENATIKVLEGAELDVNGATISRTTLTVAWETIELYGTLNMYMGKIESADSNAICTYQTGSEIFINGGTVTSKNSWTLSNKGICKISGGEVTSENSGAITNKEEATLEISGDNTKISSTASNYVTISNYGKCNIDGGTITSKNNAINNRQGGTLEISGNNTKISSTASNYVTISNYGKCNIDGGTITSKSNAINNRQGGTLEISGNSTNISSTSADGPTVYVVGTCKISGGTITSKSSSGAYATDGGTLEITGGTVQGGLYGVHSNYGTITIGDSKTAISKTNPLISGGEYGLVNNHSETWRFYNGAIRGTKGTYNKAPTTIRGGCSIATTTEGNYKKAVLK